MLKNSLKFVRKFAFMARNFAPDVKKTVKVVQFNKNHYFCIIFSMGEGA